MDLDLNSIIKKLKKFNFDRDWDRFHNPRDLLLALMSEVGELAECYRWLNEREIYKLHLDIEKRKRIEEEIADILIFLIILCYKTDMDIIKIIEWKIEKNGIKYPIEKCLGMSTNPINGFKG